MNPRYQDRVIASIWSPQAIYSRWARVECVALEFRGLPAPNPVTWPSDSAVRREELNTDHEFAAFLCAWEAQCVVVAEGGTYPSDRMAAEYFAEVHRGLTSSDIIDTAQALALIQSRYRVLELLQSLRDATFCQATGIQEQIGRTHGQWAVPRPIGHAWAVLDSQLCRCQQDIASWHIDTGKLSGPVGCGLPTHLVSPYQKALKSMGLQESPSTQVVPRLELAGFASSLARVATVCAAIADQVWLLTQSGVGEVTEGHHAANAVGSSAMPHKRPNPATSEQIMGLGRLARGYAEMLQLGIVQRGDRDLAHSCVERVALPDLLHVTCHTLTQTSVLVSGLIWNHDQIKANLQAARADGADSWYAATISDQPHRQAQARARDEIQDERNAGTE